MDTSSLFTRLEIKKKEQPRFKTLLGLITLNILFT